MAGFLKKAVDPLGLTINDDMGECFIMSGTNVVGYRVAKGLLEAGYKHIRVGVWKGKRQYGVDKRVGSIVLDELEKIGATVLTFDWTKEESYSMALSGVKSVFCTIPHMNAQAQTFSSFLKACNQAKVEHFVKVSFYGPEDANGLTPYEGVPFVKFQHECDEELKKGNLNSRMTYTLLRCAHLMSTPLVELGPVLQDECKYMSASYGMGVNYVSPNDVAKAAVNCLVNRKIHRQKVYDLTGSGTVKDRDVAKLLSKFYGTAIEHTPMGYHELEDELNKLDLPAWLVKDITMMEKVKASGIEELSSSYTGDLESVIGKKPEQFNEYLKNKMSMTIQENPTEAQV